MSENPQEEFRKLFDNKYYLFIPFAGPLVNPDKISCDQIQEAKTLRGKVIRKFVQIVEKIERLLEP